MPTPALNPFQQFAKDVHDLVLQDPAFEDGASLSVEHIPETAQIVFKYKNWTVTLQPEELHTVTGFDAMLPQLVVDRLKEQILKPCPRCHIEWVEQPDYLCLTCRYG